MKALVSVILVCGLVTPIQAQEPIRPTGKVQADSLQATSFIDALIKIATRFQLPLAVEWVKSADTLRSVRLDQRESASAMLDALLSSHDGYSWQLENGVLHVFERSLVSDTRNPLNVRVDKVPTHSLTVFAADNFLFGSIGQAVRSDAPKSFELALPLEPEPQFNLTGENAPVRQFLNQIITVSKMEIWIATFPQTLPLTVKGYWEVTPMYNTRAVKPEDQPFWIFLRWGDSLWKRLEAPEP